MDNRVFSVILLVFLLETVVTGCLPVESHSKVLIQVPEQYSAIQEAVNAANPGDTVAVSANIYYEHVVVNKSISLVGENPNITIICGNNGTKNVLLVAANDVSISGFTIKNGNSGICVNGNNITINNNIIKENKGTIGDGVQLNQSSGAKIYGNVIVDNGDGYPDLLWGNGVGCYRGSSNFIRGNLISSNVVSGVAVGGDHNIVKENNITGNGENGIAIIGGHNHLIIDNTVISNHETGIYLGSYSNTVKNNRLSENGYWDMGGEPVGGGIQLSWSSGNVIEGNLIWDNVDFGIALSDLNPGNIIRGNTILHNRNGIYFYYSNNTTVYHNNFINNTDQASVGDAYPDVEVWDNSAEGNFWSGFSGKDANLDGIIDTAYVLDVRNRDNYPLVEPWSETRTFPIIWNETTYNVTTCCNCTLANLHFKQPEKCIGFNITGPAASTAVCNVTIPLSLMCGYFSVLINNIPQPYAIYQNETHTSIYFIITFQSTKQIKILATEVVPEFPATLSLTMFLIATLLSAILLKRKHHRQRYFH
jgi:nitrous oxidase accessory protein